MKQYNHYEKGLVIHGWLLDLRIRSQNYKIIAYALLKKQQGPHVTRVVAGQISSNNYF